MHVDKIADAAVKVAQARVPEHVRQSYLAGYEARCQARGVDPAAAVKAAGAAHMLGKGLGNAFKGLRGFGRNLVGGRAYRIGKKVNLADQALADARLALQLPPGAGAADTAAFDELLAPLTRRAAKLKSLHRQAVNARFNARLGAGTAAGAYMLGKRRGYGAAGDAALNEYYG